MCKRTGTQTYCAQVQITEVSVNDQRWLYADGISICGNISDNGYETISNALHLISCYRISLPLKLLSAVAEKMYE
jgi:hypothetical protein